MTTVFDRNKMGQDLMNRTKEAPTMRANLFGKSIFKEGIEEQGVIFFKCDAKDHMVDVIPYLAGPNDPNSKIKEGDFAFVLILWVHRSIGVSKDSFLCLNLNYKKPCPVCEERAIAIEAGDEGRSKALKPTEMGIYNIVCYDNDKEVQKGVQVWAVAHWNFQRYLDKLANRPRQGGLIAYADPNNGRSIFFNREGMGPENTKFIGHSFEPRDYQISDEILAQAWSLDDLVHVPVYEEVYEAHYGEPPKPKQQQSLEKEQQASEVQRLPLRRTLDSKQAENQPADVKNFDPPANKEQAPAALSTTPATEAAVSCPGKGIFGKDTDQLDDCRDCAVYDNCARKNADEEQKRKEKLATGGTTPTSRRRTLA